MHELELKQERLIDSMELGSSQLDLLREILEIERELVKIYGMPRAKSYKERNNNN
jgi:hypothetical protein